jgi:hypothetical protein
MMSEAGTLDPADETFREYERVVDPAWTRSIWKKSGNRQNSFPRSAYRARPLTVPVLQFVGEAY